VVSSVGECTTGSETMMVGVGGIVLLVVEDERRTLTFRLFMRPKPADRDREAIDVEFVRTCCDRPRFCCDDMELTTLLASCELS
jgi:hypothetical protein